MRHLYPLVCERLAICGSALPARYCPGLMPFLQPADMVTGEPLHGWSAHFFHSQNMTFSHYDIAADAVPLHEHHHEQEEVWHIVEGELVITIDGVEQRLAAGCAAVIPPNTPHSATPVGACRAVIADFPLRPQLPGMNRS